MEGRAPQTTPTVPDNVTPLRRPSGAGVSAGAPRTLVRPPAHAFALVADDMVQCEQQLHELLGSRVDQVRNVAHYLAASGGKRIRPLLTALGARAVGIGGDLSRLMCVGEMIHLASLLHDDVVDDAPTRRGQDAAQQVYGNALVILSGDYCLARAVLLAAEEGGHGCVTGLANAVTAMAEGEVLQLQRAGDLGTSMDEYLEVIDAKSAALIAWCAGAGAHLVEDDALAARMEAFGRGVGVAFQITDDVLDYGGEQRLTGKRPGTDLLDRKLTLPLLTAMERVPGLRERLDARPPTVDELPELLQIVRDSGALDESLRYARDLIDRSIDHLSPVPEGPHKQALIDLARYLGERAS